MKAKTKKNHLKPRVTRKQRKMIEDCVSDWVHRGFMSNQEITNGIADGVKELYGLDGIRPIIAEAVEKAAAQHETTERTWDFPTDCDRLDQCGEMLESQGILFRQDYTCCECGEAADIRVEIEALHADRQGEIIGYTYYHGQDTRDVLDGEGLRLTCGAVSEDYSANESVALKICVALKRVGLLPQWDGDINRPIRVPTFTWQRRRGGLKN